MTTMMLDHGLGTDLSVQASFGDLSSMPNLLPLPRDPAHLVRRLICTVMQSFLAFVVSENRRVSGYPPRPQDASNVLDYMTTPVVYLACFSRLLACSNDPKATMLLAKEGSPSRRSSNRWPRFRTFCAFHSIVCS